MTTNLISLADFAAHNLDAVILGDCMNKLFLLNPSFIPSKELECRTSFFKVLILLQRIPIGSGSKREENLNNLLNFIKPVEILCKTSVKKYVVSTRWNLIPRQIIIQIAICKLYANLGLDGTGVIEADSFVIPSSFVYKNYKKEVSDLFEQLKLFYFDGDKASCKELQIDIETFTTKLLVTKMDQKVFSKTKVFALLKAYQIEPLVESMTKFYRNIECLMLPTPFMTVKYHPRVTDPNDVKILLKTGKMPESHNISTSEGSKCNALKLNDNCCSPNSVKKGVKRDRSRSEDDNERYVTDVEEMPTTKRAPLRKRQPKNNGVTRIRFNEKESAMIKEGVQMHGKGKWSVILEAFRNHFNPKRNSVDLKDRWRTMERQHDTN